MVTNTPKLAQAPCERCGGAMFPDYQDERDHCCINCGAMRYASRAEPFEPLVSVRKPRFEAGSLTEQDLVARQGYICQEQAK